MSITKRPDGQWRARYRDSANKEHSRHFTRKVDARRWLDEVRTSVVTGMYVDPKAGRTRLRDYAEIWRGAQVHRPTTKAHVETMLRRHAYPTLGNREIASILPSEVQAWVADLSTTLAPATVGVVHGLLSSVMKAAVADRRIVSNPCGSTRLPRRTPHRVTPLPIEIVTQVTAATPGAWQAAVVLASTTGMRQGEVLGLTLDRIDFLRRTVTVDRQLLTIAGEPPYLGPPKTAASHRTIPLPQVAVDALADHVRLYQPASLAVKWKTPEKTVDAYPAVLLFTQDGKPWSRQNFGRAWRSATKSASDCPRHRRLKRIKDADCSCITADFHELRHFYASLLIRHSESVKTVQARLGHASAAETLDTYSHLWPDSDDRTREAVDSVLGAKSAADSPAILADSLRTKRGS